MRAVLCILSFIALLCVAQAFQSIPLRLIQKSHKLTMTVEAIELGKFDSLVLESKVPVIVDFYADWCGPCKAVAPVYSAISDLYTPDKIKFFKADTDVHEDLIDKYKLQGLPLFAIFKEGKVVATHSGALNKDKLTKFVDKAIN